MGLPENGVSPATERLDAGAQLDAFIAEGRVPNPQHPDELPAHLERARRRALEKHPPPGAAGGTPQANDGVAHPEGSALATVLVLAVTLEVGVLLGILAVVYQPRWWGTLVSLAGWLQ